MDQIYNASKEIPKADEPQYDLIALSQSLPVLHQIRPKHQTLHCEANDEVYAPRRTYY